MKVPARLTAILNHARTEVQRTGDDDWIQAKEHNMASPIMRYFEYSHLVDSEARSVSAAICQVANDMDQRLPDGPEKSAGLRKLLEAKDCFVRAALPPDPVPPCGFKRHAPDCRCSVNQENY